MTANRLGARVGLPIGVVLIIIGIAIWRLEPAIDTHLHRLLLGSRTSSSLPFILHLTDIGGASGMIPATLAGGAWLFWKGCPKHALWLLAVAFSGRAIVEFAKTVIARERPPLSDRLSFVDTHSFPSSHSAGAMLTCVALCLALRAGARGWLVAFAFAIAIGATRIVLGVHWPSDVLAGWGCGLAWAFLWAPLLPPTTAPRRASTE